MRNKFYILILAVITIVGCWILSGCCTSAVMPSNAGNGVTLPTDSTDPGAIVLNYSIDPDTDLVLLEVENADGVDNIFVNYNYNQRMNCIATLRDHMEADPDNPEDPVQAAAPVTVIKMHEIYFKILVLGDRLNDAEAEKATIERLIDVNFPPDNEDDPQGSARLSAETFSTLSAYLKELIRVNKIGRRNNRNGFIELAVDMANIAKEAAGNWTAEGNNSSEISALCDETLQALQSLRRS